MRHFVLLLRLGNKHLQFGVMERPGCLSVIYEGGVCVRGCTVHWAEYCAQYCLHSRHFLHLALNQWQIYVGRSRRLVRNCGSIPQLSYSVDLWRSRDVKQL